MLLLHREDIKSCRLRAHYINPYKGYVIGNTMAGETWSESEAKEALDEVLAGAVKCSVSDVHILVGEPYLFRVGPDLQHAEGCRALTRGDVESTLAALLTRKQLENFAATHQHDFSYEPEGIPNARFRVNAALENKGHYLTFRIIPTHIRTPEEIGFPDERIWQDVLSLSRGLVLVTGVTGSGKSTTLASLIQRLNEERPEKTICIEDPIEYVYQNKCGVIVQREVGRDTLSFYDGVKWALRQDPDNILIGEIRDKETARAALTAAETGHLVFSTLHTKDAVGTINRYISFFPGEEQAEIRAELADNLTYVITQQLVPYEIRADRVLAMEVMKNTPAIQNLIREGKLHQIPTAIETGAREGMIAMDRHLEVLYRSGRILQNIALQYAMHRQTLAHKLGVE